ncbi:MULTISPECIES: hypothetical protein [Streptomyces]|uniref:Uncharacterized protein n=1 Tax=Streptomyces cyaneochromogenes TaxID=2496836 RepID=A0A3S9MHG6_9ACTN|nr:MULTISPECIES: hypothetical protein [Streptomyces]AZQ38625.1 hypothetical protein EJ357_38530 [Streptomyces cyaneochromogenes]MCL8013127.1 hypothetical protein [Streptomyces sp. AS02]
MRVVVRWLGVNTEAVLALVTAAIVGVLGLSGAVPTSIVNSAILVTLAALALSVLRDRWNAETEPNARVTLLAAHQSLELLPTHIERISVIEKTLSERRAALDEGSTITVLRGNDITESLTEARSEAKEWIFRGGTATFVRAVVLPECVQRARSNHRPLRVRMEILDPGNVALCERYANFFRHGVEDPNEDEQTWTAKGTQVELFATIVASCWWKQRYPPLEIAVALSPTMTLFRWDMTQNRLFITERGPRFPALMITEGRFYYDYWRSELLEHFNQARELQLRKACPLSAQPTGDEVRELFSRLQLELPDDFTDDDVQLIIRQAVNAENPYT